MLGVSVFSPAISFARSALVEKARAAVERAAVANGRLTASLIAIVCVSGGVRGCAVQLGVAGNGVGEGGSDTDVLQASPLPGLQRKARPVLLAQEEGRTVKLASAPAHSTISART
jgi:hypothetical protein